MTTKTILSLLLVSLIALPIPATAQAPAAANPPEAAGEVAATTGADLPPVRLMGCQGKCADFVEAKVTYNDRPYFSYKSFGPNRFIETLLRVHYIVGPDGKVHDEILALNLIGHRDALEKAVEKIRTWRFEPATSSGKPVAQSRTQLFVWQYEKPTQLAFETQTARRDTPALIEQGKDEEARTLLEAGLRSGRLRLPDRAAMAGPLAELAYKRGDYLEARRLAVMTNLSFEPQRDAYLTRIKADLMLGDVSDALYTFDLMQAYVGKLAPDSPLPKLLQTARSNADMVPLLTVQAQVPPIEDGDVYTFIPYRRTFTFQNVQGGALQKFILACNQATMESAITADAQWTIPKSWDGCQVYVRGTPGTKFAVVQPKE